MDEKRSRKRSVSPQARTSTEKVHASSTKEEKKDTKDTKEIEGKEGKEEKKEGERSRSESPTAEYRKKSIPKALREQVWVQNIGPVFNAKCKVGWCKNRITPFDYQCGHIVPESKGGPTVLENLLPICSRCNLSMSNRYTITEWNTLGSTDLRYCQRVAAKIRMFMTLLFK